MNYLFKKMSNFWGKSNQDALDYFKNIQKITNCELCGTNKATKFCKRVTGRDYDYKLSKYVCTFCELKICDSCSNCFFHRVKRRNELI